MIVQKYSFDLRVSHQNGGNLERDESDNIDVDVESSHVLITF